jgi:glycosyltransferase involved in cell wall biosynthesis
MRLLVVNYEMDDDSAVLAWQGRIARQLAKRCDRVVVLTERLGRLDAVPSNLIVESMATFSRRVPRHLLGWAKVGLQVRQLCQEHDIQLCFVHMAHPWVYRLCLWLKLSHIPVVLWYAHGSVTPSLRLALRCCDRVVTSTPEGFRIDSPKVHIIGQGVDAERFQISGQPCLSNRLLYVGRISRRKRIDLLLQTMRQIMRLRGDSAIRLRLVGPLLTDDDLIYDRALRTMSWQWGLQDVVEFSGFIPQFYLPRLYDDAFCHINVSQTGSMDKTILEALACGCPVLTTNEACGNLLQNNLDMILEDESPEAIAQRVCAIHERQLDYDCAALRRLVVGQYDDESFLGRLLGEFEELI